MNRFAATLGLAAIVALLAAMAFNLPDAGVGKRPATPLLFPRPVSLASLPLADLERWQVRALAHYTGAWKVHELVAARRPLTKTEWTHRRWFRLATAWTKRELEETRATIRLKREWSDGPSSGMWYEIAVCESSLGTGRPQWHINTGNGYYGGLQFDYGTWHEAQRNLRVYWTEYAHQASPGQQVRAAQTLPLSRWPVCGAPYR